MMMTRMFVCLIASTSISQVTTIHKDIERNRESSGVS
jgi:hypothetical protein